MEGEHEYGFWHVLVRDVCYGQIPRAARAARHLAAAGWIEEKAGERAEDLADVLAYHYQAALELNQAAGVGEQTEQLQAQVVRYLALAGERALSLDIEQAERQLARALDLCPDDAPERASLLERWAQAAQQQGRLQDARQAFERALDLYRDQGEPVAAGRVLTRLALVVHRLGDPGSEELLAEARRAARGATRRAGARQPPTPTRPGAACSRTNTPRRSRRPSGRSTLAAELDLPEPAFALHWRGVARCALGEADGLEDVRRALGLALEQGLGRETAVIHGNLGGVVWCYEGHGLRSTSCGEAIAFCERRGIAEMVLQISSAISEPPGRARTDRAGARRGRTARRPDRGGRRHVLASSPARCSCGCSPKRAPLSMLPTLNLCSLPPARSAYQTSSRSRSPPPLDSSSRKGIPSGRRPCCNRAPRDSAVRPHEAVAGPAGAAAHDARPRRHGARPTRLRSRRRTPHASGRARRSPPLAPSSPKLTDRHADAAQLYREAGERWQRIREPSRARLRPARPGPLPARARRRERGGAARRSARPVRVDGLQACACRDGEATRGDGRKDGVGLRRLAAAARRETSGFAHCQVPPT